MDAAFAAWDAEFGDDVYYTPMVEVVNAQPALDSSRTAGEARVIILRPGSTLGSGWGLAGGMHSRSSADTMIYFLAAGLLAKVTQFDRFYLAGPESNPAQQVRFEVADGPWPIGFGWYKAKIIDLPLNDAAEAAPPFPPWE